MIRRWFSQQACQLEHSLSPDWYKWNSYYVRRLESFLEFQKEHAERTAEVKSAAVGATVPIRISYEGCKDSVVVDAPLFESSPMTLFKQVQSQLFPDTKPAEEHCLLAQINRSSWIDAYRPLEPKLMESARGGAGNANGITSITMYPLSASNPMTRDHFWHSAAHLLGQTIERFYASPSSKLTVYLDDGPPVEHGFFYDYSLVDARGSVVAEALSPKDDLPQMQKILGHLCTPPKGSAGDRFERIEVTKRQAEVCFRGNPHKERILQRLGDDASITLYRCGAFVDLCRGPHVPMTSQIKIGKVVSASAVMNASQRVYGIAFRSKTESDVYEAVRQEAEKRDHRIIGKQQRLFMFHPTSPGSAFFLPHGMRIFIALQEMLRAEYRRRGYSEVLTPILFSSALWKQSGHWDFYKEDMFFLKGGDAEEHDATPTSLDHARKSQHKHPPPPQLPEGRDACCADVSNGTVADAEVTGLKPMNCPSHCLIFASHSRSYRDLPMRLADFSPLHRNEPSGSLSGLTRVRRFHQDDAHIFCRPDQISSEIQSCLEFVLSVYLRLGFNVDRDITFRLSTRPEKFVGDSALWDTAESTLQGVLEGLGKHWVVAEKDGAFYGPKIDILLRDALGRMHQCGTVQLDFQLPRRFNLSYTDEHDQPVIPVMVHRAILGSFERLLGVLTEHLGGKWPLWMSPRQVVVLPISQQYESYARDVAKTLMNDSGDKIRWVEVDARDETLNKRVRDAQTSQTNYILVVGAQELEHKSVHVRHRARGVLGSLPLPTALSVITSEIDSFDTNV
ncbi:mitochondrial threonyl-tRNA synthetase (ThrRS) [Andalucia godoyi]|uniref:threonine--tRNA ligase n=1 Tax=Andalucia godoyi TaxID=505711 RepID=A0A8K0AIZ1_ANDGO|nr:mitochondrial threonyl-tRNA synthetase (ThrRS) [Andalucia godoyi]|eukprot:ANDGO_02307.mRNA.1 mitochondrial threonyl-tRNA synthetase (ThrRS)